MLQRPVTEAILILSSTQLKGRRCLASLLIVLAQGWLWSGAALAVDLGAVAQRARQLAAKPHEAPASRLPKELASLSYDQLRDIRYKADRFLWRGAKSNFELAFFHQGLYFDHPVKINEVSSDGVREIAFNPDDFDYGANKLEPQKFKGIGFAGFRVHYPVNTPHYKDEVVVFLGASYFRALGRGQRYGASSRGLAIDTGLASGEEFPRFVEYWIERPSPSAKELVIYALLDSRSAAGAYRFVVRPGPTTAVEVKIQLYFRNKVSKFGVAPLTSMFFYGENQRPPAADDYRPEVHDSDGLSVRTENGEWIWRPLVNPRRLLVTSFATSNPMGFGLMQRDRSFSSYEDLEARYENRPAVWVEPKGKWGAGRVELVALPTPDETNDNIVAFWVPATAPNPGGPYEIEYRLLWQMEQESTPPLGWVTQTRRGTGFTRKPERNLSFVIDFDGPGLRKLKPDAKVESAFSSDSNGQILESVAYRHDVTGGWRVALKVRRADDKKPLDLRGSLRLGDETISETWSYLLPAE
jgi:periplasmic glucans biosynthesis protein